MIPEGYRGVIHSNPGTPSSVVSPRRVGYSRNARTVFLKSPSIKKKDQATLAQSARYDVLASPRSLRTIFLPLPIPYVRGSRLLAVSGPDTAPTARLIPAQGIALGKIPIPANEG